MSRRFRWTLACAFLVAACGSGEPEASASGSAASSQAVAPPSRPAPEPEPIPEPEDVAELDAAESAGRAEMVAPSGRLFTVQVAAFLSADSARIWSERLERRGLPVWTSVHVEGGRTFHRVRIGADARLAEVRRLGQRVGSDFNWPVWIAPVESTARIPADLVERTRAHLGSE